jgi:hypothetical protein
MIREMSQAHPKLPGRGAPPRSGLNAVPAEPIVLPPVGMWE